MMIPFSSSNFTITIENDSYTAQKEKMYIALNKNGRLGYNNTTISETYFFCKSPFIR
jgi:hypothetical protein